MHPYINWKVYKNAVFSFDFYFNKCKIRKK